VVVSKVLNADVTAITDMFNIVIHKIFNCIVYADGVGEQAAGSQPSQCSRVGR